MTNILTGPNLLKIDYKNIFILFLLCFSFTQEIPNEFYDFKEKQILMDCGLFWDQNSTFGPIRFSHITTSSDSLIARARFGSTILNNGTALYAFGHFTFKKQFHGYLYPRIVDNPDFFPRFSGEPRLIHRFGFSSGETDLSGISYENGWMILQFGRGRQSWGAGEDIQLSLSHNSNAYDYGMLDLDFNNLRVRYFHGFLETDTLSVNRYIVGRGIEWNNERNILIGLSEIIIYSGANRPLDISYMNPIATHLEIELNERQNQLGTASGNGVWQLSLDMILKKKLKLSINYMFDEFVLDKIQLTSGKSHGDAYSIQITQILSNNKNYLNFIYCSLISVGTNTFQHQKGNNNFVQKNVPLGYFRGNDVRESKIGIKGILFDKLIGNFEFGILERGENNFIEKPYEGYHNYFGGFFPSGNVKKSIVSQLKFQWWWKKNISFFFDLQSDDVANLSEKLVFFIGLDAYFEINKIL